MKAIPFVRYGVFSATPYFLTFQMDGGFESGIYDNENSNTILLLGDKDIKPSYDYDNGIAAQTILLGAVEKGMGGCMIASVQRARLRAALNIPERYEILLVLALGKPIETVMIEAVQADGDIKYWRDSQGRHHVPKRSLADVIIN